jgi:two-component system response regulator RegA
LPHHSVAGGPRSAHEPRGAGVLVVSEVAAVARQLRDGLWDYDIKTAWVRSGERAHAFTARHRVDALLVDLEIDRVAPLIASLRHTSPAGRILAFTRCRVEASARVALTHGAEEIVDPRDIDRIARALGAGPANVPGQELMRARARAEAAAIQQVLAECAGNRTEASRRLGISRVQLWRRLKAI